MYIQEAAFEASPFIFPEAFDDSVLNCVRVAKGVNLKYKFRKHCIIREIDFTENEYS
jgi:hypothetical protein